MLDDEAGLAGIEVEITDVADGPGRTHRVHRFTAGDLKEGVTPYDVPEHGTAYAMVRLTQDGEVVAMGVAEWALEPEVRWKVDIQRLPWPPLVGIAPTEDLQAEYGCSWRWSHHIWRFDIREDYLNYPGESLWLVLWRFYNCPPDIVCF